MHPQPIRDKRVWVLVLGKSNKLSSQSPVGEVLTESTPNYWLLFASRSTWKHLQSKGEWAFEVKVPRKAKELAENDIGVVYLRHDLDGDSALGGLVKFSGKLYRTRGRDLFDQMFPFRISITVKNVSDPPIDFRPLIDRIAFITNKSNWGSHLQGRAMQKLDESDYILFRDAIQERK